MTTSSSVRTSTGTTSAGVHPAYRALIGLAALAILLQGLWAGIFLQGDDRDKYHSWINVHSAGGEVAIVLAALAAVVAFWKMRDRKDVWGGTAVLTVLLVVEAYLGGRISENGNDSLTAVHIPLALALMGLVIYLVVQARRPLARG